MDDMREKLIKIIQDSVGGCSRYWAGVIADGLIANGVTIQPWIPAMEPPKERDCYLVTVKHWLDGKPVSREAYWNGVDWLSCYKRDELTPRVTHWMPLPDGPREV